MAEANEFSYKEPRDNVVKSRFGTTTVEFDTAGYRKYLRKAAPGNDNELFREEHIRNADVIFNNDLTWQHLLQDIKQGKISMPAYILAKNSLRSITKRQMSYAGMFSPDSSLTELNLEVISKDVEARYSPDSSDSYLRILKSKLNDVIGHETTHLFQHSEFRRVAEKPGWNVFCQNAKNELIEPGVAFAIPVVSTFLAIEAPHFQIWANSVVDTTKFVSAFPPELIHTLQSIHSDLSMSNFVSNYPVVAVGTGLILAGSSLVRQGALSYRAYRGSGIEKDARDRQSVVGSDVDKFISVEFRRK